MHLDWENDGRRRRFASLRETSIVVQKFLYTFLHPMLSFSRAKDVVCVLFSARFGQSFFAAGKIFSSRLLSSGLGYLFFFKRKKIIICSRAYSYSSDELVLTKLFYSRPPLRSLVVTLPLWLTPANPPAPWKPCTTTWKPSRVIWLPTKGPPRFWPTRL